MIRKSDTRVFTVSGDELAEIYARRLMEKLFSNNSSTLQRRAPPAPDFVISANGRIIGLEVTQPALCTLPQSNCRRLEEVFRLSDERFDSLNGGDCRVNFYIKPTDDLVLPHRSDDQIKFVDEVARLIRDAARAFDPPVRYLDISVEHDRVWVMSNDRSAKLVSVVYPTIPRPLSLAAFSETGTFNRPFFWSGGRSWAHKDIIRNRKAIIKSIETKAMKIEQYQSTLDSEEVWLLVHPPRFGAARFDAGDYENWDSGRIARAGQGFGRIFFVEFSDIYEVKRPADAASNFAISQI